MHIVHISQQQSKNTTQQEKKINYCWGGTEGWITRSIFVEAYRLTKHLRTSSCLQTNSIKRGDVILFKNHKMFLVSATETNLNYINSRDFFKINTTQIETDAV